MESAKILDIGTRRELFVDRYLIDSMDGASLKLNEPRDEGPALRFDRPWEGLYPCYATVFKDGDVYRMYYRGRTEVSGGGGSSAVTCYAESTDGVTWARPNLGLFEVTGTRDNNVVLANAPRHVGNFSPLLDTRPGVDPAQRYKAFAGGPPTAFVSADGIRWAKLREEPVLSHDRPAWDSQNLAFWSESEGCYVGYFRTHRPSPDVEGHGYRWVSRSTSEDFVSWGPLLEMDAGDTPPEHLYTNGTHPYFRAPHIYIALAKRFLPGKAALTPEQANTLVVDPGHGTDSSDAVFMTSRGGNQYDRTFMEAFIRPGPSARDWVARDNTPALGVVPTGPRDLSIYRVSHYGQPTAHMTRYSMRLDGFVSVNGGYAGGEMLTKPFRFEGSQLELNYATGAAGGALVEVQDEAGRPIPGYELDECRLIFGDEIARTVSWSAGPDLGALQGMPVRLRFHLSDADLFSMRFRA